MAGGCHSSENGHLPKKSTAQKSPQHSTMGKRPGHGGIGWRQQTNRLVVCQTPTRPSQPTPLFGNILVAIEPGYLFPAPLRERVCKKSLPDRMTAAGARVYCYCRNPFR